MTDAIKDILKRYDEIAAIILDQKVDEFSEGLGLGLSLCRRLATLLNGEIVLDTQYSGGARFLLKLPI